MELDTDKTFREIYQDEAGFRDHLLALRGCIDADKNRHLWAHNLSFIAPADKNQTQCTFASSTQQNDDNVETSDVSPAACSCAEWPSFRGHETEKTLRVTPAGCCPDCTHYVAVSWPWKATDPACDYYVKGVTERISTVPSSVMSRAVAFAANKDAGFIWIDKECINQTDRDDKEAGMQSMDLVYQRSKWPVGLLKSYFDKQEHLDTWDFLITHSDCDELTIDGELPLNFYASLLEVLQILAKDEWFTRAWILQECVSSTAQMLLLARHTPGLTRAHTLGTIEGEIEISIEKLQFCLISARVLADEAEGVVEEAMIVNINDLIDTIDEALPLHSRSNGWTDQTSGIDIGTFDPTYRQTCDAAHAMALLRSRENRRVPDRIAILGNLCNYSIRINTKAVEQLNQNGEKLGFSVCAFALALFNGDFSLTFPRDTYHSIASSHFGYCWGPGADTLLQQLDEWGGEDIIVRAPPPSLTQKGELCLSGWLWIMGADDQIPLPMTLESRLQGPSDHDPGGARVLWSIIRDLYGEEEDDLADMLWESCKMDFFGTKEDLLRNPTPASVPEHLDEVMPDEVFEMFGDEEGPSLQNWATHTSSWFSYPALMTGVLAAATLTSNHFAPEQSDAEDPADGGGESETESESSETSRRELFRPSAIFDLQREDWHLVATMRSQCTSYIFTPMTALDTKMRSSQKRGEPLSWIVEPPCDSGRFQRDQETGHRVLKGVKTCRGYWKIPEDAKPRTYIFI